MTKMPSTMDLHSEASSETRILLPRHISAGKALDAPNNAVNKTFLCHSYTLQPDTRTYVEDKLDVDGEKQTVLKNLQQLKELEQNDLLCQSQTKYLEELSSMTALQVYGWVLWSCALLAVCIICALYIFNLRAAFRHWRGAVSHAAVVLAVYPVVSISAFMALLVPRTQVLSEAISQEAVMLGLYHFYCLVIAECGGPEQLVRRSEVSRLETRVLPCCFYPCCIIPQPKLQTRHFKWLRCLLLQVPVIQGLIYVAILVMRSEDVSVYLSNYIYFQPLVAASILSGIWGMMMCLKAAESTGARPRPRFLALQFALIIVKVQCGVAKTLSTTVAMPCLVALNPSVLLDIIHNTATILEMLLLSIWAWRLYKVPPGKIMGKEQNIMPAE